MEGKEYRLRPDAPLAVVLSTSSFSSADTLPVHLAGFGHANDFFPAERRDPTAFDATRVSWQRALAMAGVELGDLDFAEVHNCFFAIPGLLCHHLRAQARP